MRTYAIGRVAERSGFSASSLRYYEGIGLVEPMTRTDSGYRLYDDGTLDRLSFIARAKELGCSLEEITDLVSIWDGDRCGPVQRRFHDLVTAKIADSQRRTSPSSSPSPRSSRWRPPSWPARGRRALRRRLRLLGAAPPPIACTLDPSAMGQQLAQWQGRPRVRPARHDLGDGGLRIEFAPDVPVAEVARLATEEQRCCRSSRSASIDERGVGLEVRVPEGAAEVVAALFQAPA